MGCLCCLYCIGPFAFCFDCAYKFLHSCPSCRSVASLSRSTRPSPLASRKVLGSYKPGSTFRMVLHAVCCAGCCVLLVPLLYFSWVLVYIAMGHKVG